MPPLLWLEYFRALTCNSSPSRLAILPSSSWYLASKKSFVTYACNMGHAHGTSEHAAHTMQTWRCHYGIMASEREQEQHSSLQPPSLPHAHTHKPPLCLHGPSPLPHPPHFLMLTPTSHPIAGRAPRPAHPACTSASTRPHLTPVAAPGPALSCSLHPAQQSQEETPNLPTPNAQALPPTHPTPASAPTPYLHGLLSLLEHAVQCHNILTQTLNVCLQSLCASCPRVCFEQLSSTLHGGILSILRHAGC